MANYRINNRTIHLTVLLICIAVTSCKKSGEHIVINHTLKEEVQIDNNMSIPKVNTDSIKNEIEQRHEKINLKEHRVYYVDFSYSMISDDKYGKYKNKNVKINGKETGKTLLELVKDSLKQSIRNIQGENVFIEIIPFLDNELWPNATPTDVFRIVKGNNFNNSELKMMDEFIDNINAIKKTNGSHYNTHHSIAIKDFLENRISNDNQYHMMILLTDGVDESSKNNLKSGATILDDEWYKTKDNYVFGIFVNLMKDYEITGDLPNRFKGKFNEDIRRFYKQGLNFDFNVFLMEPKDTVEHRKCNIAYIPIGGFIPMFEPTIQEDEHYKYTILEQPYQNSKWIEIQVDTLTPASIRPNIHIGRLSYSYKLNKTNNYANSEFITSGNTIELTIIDEKTPNVKFLLPSNKKDSIPTVTKKMNFCKKLFGIEPEWSDTVTICIQYEKSNDAKFKDKYNNLKLTITEVPEYAELLGAKEMYLDKPIDTLLITFTLKQSHENLNKNSRFKGEFKIENADNFRAVFVNGIPFNNIGPSNIVGKYEFIANECWHPLQTFLFWFLISSLILFTILLSAILIYRTLQPKFTDRIPVMQFGTEPLAAYRNLEPNDFPFQKYGYLNKFIHYVRLDTSVEKESHKIWHIGNILNFKRALQGDIHIHPLEKNIFAKSIEFRPVSNGVSVFVDDQYKCTIETLNETEVLAEKIDNESLYRLIVYGLQQPLIDNDRY